MHPTIEVPGIFYIEVLRDKGKQTFVEIIRNREKPFKSRAEAQTKANQINNAFPNEFASVRFAAFDRESGGYWWGKSTCKP